MILVRSHHRRAAAVEGPRCTQEVFIRNCKISSSSKARWSSPVILRDVYGEVGGVGSRLPRTGAGGSTADRG
jgi:hypothetical protein